MRYSQETILELLKLAWWNWPQDKIERNLPALETGDVIALKRA
jgi:virginiamycin A acetyltransferase